MAEQHSIDEAIAHLGAALAQSIAEDDQIIMGHVRHAHTLLKPLHSAYGTGSTGTHDDLVAALRDARDFADNELCAREQACFDDGEDEIIRNGKPYVGEARDLVAKIDAALSKAGAS